MSDVEPVQSCSWYQEFASEKSECELASWFLPLVIGGPVVVLVVSLGILVLVLYGVCYNNSICRRIVVAGRGAADAVDGGVVEAVNIVDQPASPAGPTRPSEIVV